MAIENGITVDRLALGEFAYCPAVNEFEDPLFKAALFCVRRM
jgi:hypothetical protein